MPEPYAVTDTEYQDVPTTIYQTIATTFYEDLPTTQVQQVPTTIVQDVPTTVYLTSLTTEPAVTVFITSTTVDTLPPVTITSRCISRLETQRAYKGVATTSQCEFCKIDIYAKALAFPTSYIYTTVWPTTYRVQKTVYEDINSTVYSTSTIFAQTTCIETPETTWEYSGVILTSPTTYLAYTDISRGFLEPRPTVYGCGELVFEPLELGPAATDLNELVIATTAIPTGPTGAPLQLLNYLDTLPTVVQQLDGVPASSCDLPSISSVEPLAPQETAKLATTTQGFIFQFAPVVRALANVATGGAATATATSSAVSAPVRG